MQKKEAIVAGAALALVLYTLALSVLGPFVLAAMRSQTISNAGSVKAIGVGVYWDQSCSNTVTSIDWGILEPSMSVNKTVYIRNEGNALVGLSIAASNWSPPDASSYMTLSWDYGGQILDIGEVVQISIKLSVSPDVTGITSFSFVITITASE